jgi:hypothetical protein
MRLSLICEGQYSGFGEYMIKNITIWMLLLALVMVVFGQNLQAVGFNKSVLIGTAVSIGNLLGLYFIWKLIFSKKNVALAALAIIFKYVVLGLVLWKMASIQELNPIGLVLGLGTLVVAVLLATAQKVLSEKFLAKKS